MSIFDWPSINVEFLVDYNDSYNMNYKKGQVISVRKTPGSYVAVLGQGDFQDIPREVVKEVGSMSFHQYTSHEVDGKIVGKSVYSNDGKIHQLPVVKNVGELKSILAQLPDELPVNLEYSDGIKPVWSNVGLSSMESLIFRENDGRFK